MASKEQLSILKQGVAFWNNWRYENLGIKPDLSGAELDSLNLQNVNLSGTNLIGANLSNSNIYKGNLFGSKLCNADLSHANLSETNLVVANLNNAKLCGADLKKADLWRADLVHTDLHDAHLDLAYLCEADLSMSNLSKASLFKADLSNADLVRANLTEANLMVANLNGADLQSADLSFAMLSEAVLVETDLANAILHDCSIHGISVWGVNLKGAKQSNLRITNVDEPTITVDNIKIAQFIYLLMDNEEIRELIDTVSKKVVLILGRFTPERKEVLDIVRDELRKRNFVSVMFDFQKPTTRTFRDTITTLARISRFIIADLTDPKVILQELEAIVPTVRVPIQPLLLKSSPKPSILLDFEGYSWFLPVYEYQSIKTLITSLDKNVIDPAMNKANELDSKVEPSHTLSDTFLERKKKRRKLWRLTA